MIEDDDASVVSRFEPIGSRARMSFAGIPPVVRAVPDWVKNGAEVDLRTSQLSRLVNQGPGSGVEDRARPSRCAASSTTTTAMLAGCLYAWADEVDQPLARCWTWSASSTTRTQLDRFHAAFFFSSTRGWIEAICCMELFTDDSG